MKMEDYKAYMERVETTAEMDERVLKNLKNSVAGESISNKNFWQQTMPHTRTFLYRTSVVVVCCLVILLIGKSYTRMRLSGENSNTQKDVQGDSTNIPEDTTYLKTPHFSNLYGQEIGSHATNCNYIDEDTHVRICIQEMISDECVTEFIGYYEAKDDLGVAWLQKCTSVSDFNVSNNFPVSLKPDMSKWPETMVKPNHMVGLELDEYYTFHGGDYQTKQLKTYNTHKRTYFDYYVIVHPDFETKNITIGYKLYAAYKEISFKITKPMKSKVYPLENVKKSEGKHYQPSEVILSPLGGLMIKGKDLGIEPSSIKTADNFTTLQLNLQYSQDRNKKITIVENEVFRSMKNCDGGIWCAPMLSEEQKKALGTEYNLFVCRLSPDIDLTKSSSIQIDDASYPLANTYENAISDDELNDLLKIITEYYQKKLSWEVIDYQIADNDHSFYQLYKDYEPGNIIVFEVHTTNNPSGLYRSIALGRKKNNTKWEVLNEGV